MSGCSTGLWKKTTPMGDVSRSRRCDRVLNPGMPRILRVPWRGEPTFLSCRVATVESAARITSRKTPLFWQADPRLRNHLMPPGLIPSPFRRTASSKSHLCFFTHSRWCGTRAGIVSSWRSRNAGRVPDPMGNRRIVRYSIPPWTLKPARGSAKSRPAGPFWVDQTSAAPRHMQKQRVSHVNRISAFPGSRADPPGFPTKRSSRSSNSTG
jgi:hypothetical protein